MICLALGACASNRAVVTLAPGGRVVELAPIPDAPEISTGFDTLEPERDWDTGDTVAYALTLRSAEEARHSIIEVTTSGIPVGTLDFAMTLTASGERREFEIPMIRCFVNHFEWDGVDPSTMRPTGDRASAVPAVAFENGLFEQMQVWNGGERPFETLGPQEIGWTVALFTMSRLFEAGEHEGRFVRSLIRTPSLMSMILVEISLDYLDPERPGEPVEVVLGDQRVEGVRVGMMLLLNDRPALVGSVVSVPVSPPLGPGNGVVLIEASHATDPARTATLRLIGARRDAFEFEAPGGADSIVPVRVAR